MSKKNEDIKKDSPLDDESKETISNFENNFNINEEILQEIDEETLSEFEEHEKQFVTGIGNDSYFITTNEPLNAQRDKFLETINLYAELELYAVEYTMADWQINGVVVLLDTMKDFANSVVGNFNEMIKILNERPPKGAAPQEMENYRQLNWPSSKGLSPAQAVRILTLAEKINMVVTPETMRDPRAEGPICRYNEKTGLYEFIGDGLLNLWIELLGSDRSSRWKSEFYTSLHDYAARPENRILECDDPNIIALNNTLFNYETKERIPFSPDYVFLSKLSTNLAESLPSIPYHIKPDGTRISPLDWINELAADNQKLSQALLVIACACVRPKWIWRQMALLYNSGKNGKSTFLEMINALVGESNVMPSSLEDLSNTDGAGRFALAGIVGKSLVLCDDSDTHTYIKNTRKLKTLIAHGTIAVERKGENMFSYRPLIFLLAAANDLPKSRDKSQAWLDRLVLVPFPARFDGDEDDKLIQPWVKSREFGEYMLYHLLVEMDKVYELLEPSDSKALKEEYVMENDPVVEFYHEYITNSREDFLANCYLWELFNWWLKQNRPNTPVMSNRTFIKRLNIIVEQSGKWIQPKASDGKGLFVNSDNWHEVSRVLSIRINDKDVYYSGRQRGIVRKKMWEYCQDNNTCPKDLMEQGKYKQVCEDLGLDCIEK